MVISAVRTVVRRFDSTLIIISASDEPFIAESVSQPALSETVHDVFDVIENVPSLFADAPTVTSEWEIVRLPPFCVTTKT